LYKRHGGKRVKKGKIGGGNILVVEREINFLVIFPKRAMAKKVRERQR